MHFGGFVFFLLVQKKKPWQALRYIKLGNIRQKYKLHLYKKNKIKQHLTKNKSLVSVQTRQQQGASPGRRSGKPGPQARPRRQEAGEWHVIASRSSLEMA